MPLTGKRVFAARNEATQEEAAVGRFEAPAAIADNFRDDPEVGHTASTEKLRLDEARLPNLMFGSNS